jgi:hypothetical protein
MLNVIPNSVTTARTWKNPGTAMITAAPLIVKLDRGFRGALVHVLVALGAASEVGPLLCILVAAGSVVQPPTWLKHAITITAHDFVRCLPFQIGVLVRILVAVVTSLVHAV